MALPAALPVIDAAFPLISERIALSAELSSPHIPGHKDVSKRKRVNRIAKLKQCKLDARREQWLSQVSSKHKLGQERCNEAPCEDQETSNSGQVVDPVDKIAITETLCLPAKESEQLHGTAHSLLQMKSTDSRLQDLKLDQCSLDTEDDRSSPSASSCCTSDFSEADSSPKSCCSESPEIKGIHVGKEFRDGRERKGHDFDKNAITGCDWQERKSETVSNFGKGPSDQVLELEDDDWEAVADALSLNILTGRTEVIETPATSFVQCTSPQVVLKPDTRKKPSMCGAMLRSASGRAWRSDDTCRPSSLPSLGKQQSLPVHFGYQQKQWPGAHKSTSGSLPSCPTQCPICTEVLDSTDSSFDPCSCGFQLCLFCHHRILSDDGRCPGCRKAYSTAVPVKTALSPALR